MSAEDMPVECQFDSSVNDDEHFDKENIAFEVYRNNVLTNSVARDGEYYKILSSYRVYIQYVLETNPNRQKWFFRTSMGILIASFVLLVATILWIMVSNCVNIAAVAAAIAAGVETLVSFLIFPKIIAKYLFNTGENANIRDIINSIRKYDLEITKVMKAPMPPTDEKTS